MIPNIDLSYLQATISWLDLRLEREVLRWQAAGQDGTDRFRGLHISDDEARALTLRGVGSHWDSAVSLPQTEEERLERGAADALGKIQEIEKRAEDVQVRLRLKALAEIFGLSAFEWWSFIVCLAPALDLRYDSIYAYLQDNVTRVSPSADLMLNLLAEGEALARLEYLRCFSPFAPLRRFCLLLPVEEPGKPESQLRQAFRVAPGLVDWLLGAYSPVNSLGDCAALYLPPEKDEPVGPLSALEKLPAPEIFINVKPFVSLYGSDLLQQETIARQMAAGLGAPLLRIRFAPAETVETALEKLSMAVRDARLLGALLYLQGCDLLLDGEGCLLPSAFDALRLASEGVLLSSKSAFKFSPEMPGNDYPLMSVALQGLPAGERVALWKDCLAEAAQNLDEKELAVLAGQFALTSGQIVAAASTAMSQALQESRALTGADLFAAARLHSGQRLAGLADKIEPRYDWHDLVLPETPLGMLQELVEMVRNRPLVLGEWGLGRKLTAGAGVAALFSGPPGTGKTLAAQIMAQQLGIDLYRIDLSTVVSKYIGETEKNLERIFTDAAQSNAILFFDEADTIFGKRSDVKDAHDRYANLEVGYLLQRMETYSGVAILATNLRANLDEAFTRRLQFIINFPFPDEEYRLKIWQVLLPPEMPRAGDLDLGLMAKRFKLAGGNIRNIIVSAAYLAAADGRRVEMSHLMHGARREIQKMGKLLHETDFIYS